MSKTKLALLILALTFGVNSIPFLVSKKSFTVEEVKNVWIYELPATASPLDSHVALGLGPHQGIVGTLFMPDYLKSSKGMASLLAESWQWIKDRNELVIRLRKDLVFQNGDPVLPIHFKGLRDLLKEKNPKLFETTPAWRAWMNADLRGDDQDLVLSFGSKGATSDFDLEVFLSEVLTHPLSGAVHPANLKQLRDGNPITKEWISSGPYKVRKWNPKEITLVSREDFPIRLPDPFFRTLKYQSAPVKNPSCDFLLGGEDEAQTLASHSKQETGLELTVFWVCRSFREKGVCGSPESRLGLARALARGDDTDAPVDSLKGAKVRYRIPVGSEAFRGDFRSRIEKKLVRAGAIVEETSYFFKSSEETDLELQFVVTPSDSNRREFAQALSGLSTRLGFDTLQESDLIGEVTHFPLSVFMKKMKGGIFEKVFLEPDFDEKRMPL